MPRVKQKPVATLIGDVIGSRRAGQRTELHRALTGALDTVNRTLGPSDPLRVTVGDEFQGAFDRIETAVRASLRVRLGLLPAYDVRIGLGWGEVSWIDRSAGVQDGPGWWAARDAIDLAKARARGSLAPLRTCLRGSGPDDEPGPAQRWNALLLCRDAVVSDLDHRSVVTLTALLEGRSQQAIARDLGVSASAVTQRIRRDGLAMIVAADQLLEDP